MLVVLVWVGCCVLIVGFGCGSVCDLQFVLNAQFVLNGWLVCCMG